MEELESVLESSSNGTVVTSRYFLQPVEELAKKHSVRAVAVDLNCLLYTSQSPRDPE